jgi:hypothetical protein
MGDNEMCNYIRSIKAWREKFNRLSNDERRQVLYIAGGNAGQIAEAFEFVFDRRRDQKREARMAA